MADLDLVALKPMKYLTRRLQPGDTFTAKNRSDYRIYQAINKARADDSPPEATGEDADLTAVRAEYRDKMGKQPYHGWDADTLREKMAES